MKNLTKVSLTIPSQSKCICWDTNGLPQCYYVFRVESGQYRCEVFDKALFCDFTVGVHKCEECKKLLQFMNEKHSIG